jgi:hypothetical protein
VETLRMAEKHDCVTLEEFLREKGEDLSEWRKRPTPWWMVQNQPEPTRPRRLIWKPSERAAMKADGLRRAK